MLFRSAGVEQGGEPRRRRLRNLAELEADGVFRPPPPASPEGPFWDDSDDDSDTIPLSARMQRTTTGQSSSTPAPSSAPGASSGATPTMGPVIMTGPIPDPESASMLGGATGPARTPETASAPGGSSEPTATPGAAMRDGQWSLRRHRAPG